MLPTPIPDKGRVLTALSTFWFGTLAAPRPHHLRQRRTRASSPRRSATTPTALEGRSMLVRRAERIDIECVVRGYLTGSGWKEYRQHGTRVRHRRCRQGSSDGSRLDPPIFTPTTKAERGTTRTSRSSAWSRSSGARLAEALREAQPRALRGGARARVARGLVLADTKFEFGVVDGALTLIDELLSPDSSRYWDRAEYEAGRRSSFDKQYVRDWLDQ